MKFGSGHSDASSQRGQSLDGKFRRSRTGISPDRRSCFSTARKSFCHSKGSFKGLEEYSEALIDIEIFSNSLEDWVHKKIHSKSTDLLFKSPFVIDELRKLDYALEGVLLQQLFRMPNLHFNSDNCREEQFLALQDFLLSAINGLWRTFWHKTGPLPFSVSCPRYPGLKFDTVDKAISTRLTGGLCGAAVLAKDDTDLLVLWDHVLELALFKSELKHGNDPGFSAVTLCEAIFYGVHILLSRSLSKCGGTRGNSVYLLVLDSKFGGVVKFGGDLSKLELNSHEPYHSVVEWIKHHAEVNVSPISRIWNQLGNANWGDVGVLQLLLATYSSIVQWKGPPRKSIASLAANHSLRLQKRRIEFNAFHTEPDCIEKQDSFLMFNPGEVILMDNSEGQKALQVKETLLDGKGLSYRAILADDPCRLLTVFIGAHSSRLELSWEGMSLWYHVQRQTKVLSIMKQNGIISRYLPEVIASGHLLHPGSCTKPSPEERCEHPQCGAPILVTYPVGESASSLIARDGPFPMEDALRCCRDILMALRIAAAASIQHGDICPENIIRVLESSRSGAFYVPVSWGRAVLEDSDSPALNLQFSSIHALCNRKLCPSSDVESLVYLLYFVCGGTIRQQDSIEGALRLRERCWSERVIQWQLSERSPILKAFADYVDSLRGTPYPVEYDIWLRRLNRALVGSAKGKSTQSADAILGTEDVVGSSSGASVAGPSFSG